MEADDNLIEETGYSQSQLPKVIKILSVTFGTTLVIQYIVLLVAGIVGYLYLMGHRKVLLKDYQQIQLRKKAAQHALKTTEKTPVADTGYSGLFSSLFGAVKQEVAQEEMEAMAQYETEQVKEIGPFAFKMAKHFPKLYFLVAIIVSCWFLLGIIGSFIGSVGLLVTHTVLWMLITIMLCGGCCLRPSTTGFSHQRSKIAIFICLSLFNFIPACVLIFFL